MYHLPWGKTGWPELRIISPGLSWPFLDSLMSDLHVVSTTKFDWLANLAKATPLYIVSGLGDCRLTALTLSQKLLLLPKCPLEPTWLLLLPPSWLVPTWPLFWLDLRRWVSSWQRRCKHFCRKRFCPPNLVLSLQYLQYIYFHCRLCFIFEDPFNQ